MLFFLLSFFLTPLVGFLAAAVLPSKRWTGMPLPPPAGVPFAPPPAPLPLSGPEVKEYYAAVHGEQRGPFTREELRVLWSSGQVPGDSLYWKEGMTEWRPIGEALG